jgi:hypothetical protein
MAQRKIYAFFATVGLLTHVVGGPAGADNWLTTPVTRLLGNSPVAYKDTEEG